MEFGKIDNVVAARFNIVTPMFLGGADQKAEELRPASVKGMLRFWWRALNWNSMRKGAADDASALRRLHDEESRLFGSATSNGMGGQGEFLFSVTYSKINEYKWNRVQPQVGYLLGMGLFHFKNGVTRTSIRGDFSLGLRFRTSTSQADRTSVLHALRIFGLIGGMGSRQRRGLGSVALMELSGAEQFVIPKNARDYASILSGLLANFEANLPPFSAFSALSKIAYLSKPTSMAALEAMGDELGMYRGWGREGKVFGKPAKPQFKSDHDNMYAAANGKTYPDAAPKRLVFGMPHNYRFSSGGNVSIQNTALKLQRRASPLFIHVHQFQQEELAVGVMLMLPALFLPSNDQIEIKGKVCKKVAPKVDWNDMEKLLLRPAFTQGGKS